MNDLIQISKTQINGADVNSVNLRELHSQLNSKRKFADYAKCRLGRFVENEDYICISQKSEIGNKPLIEYFVTIDTAKMISMLENNKVGDNIRRYFVEVEKKSQIVLSTSEQITLLAQGHQEVENRIMALEKTKRLENWQERSLQDAKNRKVYEIAQDDKEFASKLHRKVWSLFKKKFHLPRYNELPAIKFEDGLSYVNNLTIADMVA